MVTRVGGSVIRDRRSFRLPLTTPEPSADQPLIGDVARHVLDFVPLTPRVAMTSGRSEAVLWYGGTDGRLPKMTNITAGNFIQDMQFSPSGNELVTASFAGNIRIWDTKSGRLLRQVFVGPEIFVVRVAANGKRFFSLDAGRIVTVWESWTATPLMRLELPEAHQELLVLPDGRRIVTGISRIAGGSAVIWDLGTGGALHSLRHEAASRDDVMFFLKASQCGAKLVTAGFSRIFVWNSANGELEHEFGRPLRSQHAISGLAISAGGSKIVSSQEEDRRIYIWSGLTGQLSRTISADAEVEAFELLSDGGRFLVASTALRTATVWDTELGKPLRKLDGGTGGGAQNIAVAPGGGVVAICGGPPVESIVWTSVWATVWETSSGRMLHDMQMPGSQIVRHGQILGLCSVAISRVDSVVTQ